MDPDATLNQLEGPGWADPPVPPPVGPKLRALANVPLRELIGCDYALLLRSKRALRTVVPLALVLIEHDPFADRSDPGDVLIALLALGEEFWQDKPALRLRLDRIVAAALSGIDEIQSYHREYLEPLLRKYASGE